MEAAWEDPERDAAVGRKWNLWSTGCRSLADRHQTPPVILSMTDVLTRLSTNNAQTWGQLSYRQLEILRTARRTLFEMRVAEATRRARS